MESNKATYALFSLLTVVTILSIFGIVMLYSTTAAIYGEQKLTHQIIWTIIGIGVAFLIHRLDYRKLGAISHILLFLISIPLIYLAAAHILIRLGYEASILSRLPFVGDGPTKGTFRWLKIGDRTIQPSEFAKLVIILYLARYYGTNPRYVHSFKKGLFRPLVIVGSVILAILLGGSFSVTVITGCVVATLLFIAGIRLRYFLALWVIGFVLMMAVVKVSPVRASRITSYRNPEEHKQTSGYQLYSSQLALGSGYWFGIGFNKSRMKEYYLPESHTDFIMAIVGEELGFLAMLIVSILYLLFVGAAFFIGGLAVDREGMLLACGIGVSIGLHSFVNIGVVSGFVPTTGITAPLISYGGSNMIMTWASVGFLASIVRIRQINGTTHHEASNKIAFRGKRK